MEICIYTHTCLYLYIKKNLKKGGRSRDIAVQESGISTCTVFQKDCYNDGMEMNYICKLCTYDNKEYENNDKNCNNSALLFCIMCGADLR
jgi:hypothetical protein